MAAGFGCEMLISASGIIVLVISAIASMFAFIKKNK